MALPLITRLATLQLTSAGTYESAPVIGLSGAAALDISAEFSFGSGGGTGKAFLQSSLDQGQTWFDVWSFTFAVATKKRARSMLIGSLGEATLLFSSIPDDTVLFPLIVGDRLKWMVVTTGAAYAGSTTFQSWAHIR